MIFTMSLKNVGQSVLKSETLHVAQYLPQPILDLNQKLLHIDKVDSTLAKVKDVSFPSEALLCSKDELALLNMRWYLTHLLKVLHLCWFNKRNNKRVLFVDDSDILMSQSFLMSQFIKNQWEPKKGSISQVKQNDFYLLKNKTQPPLGVNVTKKKKNKDHSNKRSGFQKDGKLFGSQLFGLTEAYKSNKAKSKPGHNAFMFDISNKSLKTKMNVFIACQNSRLSMCSTKSNDLIGLFSNSTVAFKTNYLMLNNLLDYETLDAAKALVINRRTWSGFMPKRNILSILNIRSQTTVYERMMTQWYKKELTLIAKSPWKLEADMVFFTNPGKTYAMVEQIRRLGIPTSGLVDGSQIVQGSKSYYGLFAPTHSVDYAIIGNANSIYFVRSVLAKCLAVAKKKSIKHKPDYKSLSSRKGHKRSGVL